MRQIVSKLNQPSWRSIKELTRTKIIKLLFSQFHVKSYNFIHYEIIIIYTECEAHAYVNCIVVHAVQVQR